MKNIKYLLLTIFSFNWLAFSQVSFESSQQISNVSSNRSFVIDLDSDSDNDILFSSFATETLYWLENDGSNNYTQRVINNEGLNIFSIFSVDFDSDNDNDILLACKDDDIVCILYNDGSENFTKVNAGVANGPLDVSVADIDEDNERKL